MKTLKELKKVYPERIKTSGSIYYIDGQGWYRQKKTFFGVETSTRDSQGNWTRVNFENLVATMEQLYK